MGERVGGSQGDADKYQQQRDALRLGGFVSQPQPGDDGGGERKCARQQHGCVRGGRHAESRVDGDGVTDAAEYREQRDHFERWQRHARQERQCDQGAHTKAQRRHIPSCQHPFAAVA